jgi:hypothetical protein
MTRNSLVTNAWKSGENPPPRFAHHSEKFDLAQPILVYA